jgi:hypothetical protein
MLYQNPVDEKQPHYLSMYIVQNNEFVAIDLQHKHSGQDL